MMSVNETSSEEWKPSAAQISREQRNRIRLEERKVPQYHHPLYSRDDDEVVPQTAADVARRAMILWAVESYGENEPQSECHRIISELDLWDFVSPEESRFLHDPMPDDHTRMVKVWRLESIWVLLWALGYVPKLDWPSQLCDVNTLAKTMVEHEDSPQFIRKAKLRPIAELLDEQNLIMKIHWATRNIELHGNGMVPADLDWRNEDDWIPISHSQMANVVLERHWALNWLVNREELHRWDHVDLPT